MPVDAAAARVRPRTNAPPRQAETAAPTPDGYWFDEAAASAACEFFPRYLCFTKDVWSGRPFRLEPWQAEDIIRPLFGWKRRNGTRRYRRCILFIARKNGKTELGAGLGILATLGDGLRGAETYFLASTEAQARILFDKATDMVNTSPDLSKHSSRTDASIYWAEPDCIIKPLDGRARGKHGLNASAVVADEIHEWRNGDLYTTVHQSEAARSQPLELIVSTAGVRGWGYGWEVWQRAHKILDGTYDDPSTLVVIYAPDADDDWTAESTWRKANPNLGVSVQIDYLREECRLALGNPRLENDFRRYHLNQWAGQSERWLQMHRWDAGKKSDWTQESDLVGRSCVAGIDLSSTNDFTCIAYAFAPAPGAEDQSWRRVYRYFYPEKRVEDRARQTGVPIERWVKSGALIVTPGTAVDYAWVAAQLKRDADCFDIRMVGIDRWNCLHFTHAAEKGGFPRAKIVKVGQGFASMSEPSKAYEDLVYAGLLDHGGHPVTRWMADNVMVARDPAGNIKPAKDRAADKIDGIVADIIAQFVAINGQTPDGLGVID